MLILRISSDDSRDHVSIEVTRQVGPDKCFLASYNAVGALPQNAGSYHMSRIILNDTFDREDVRNFGRYGIVELVKTRLDASTAEQLLYISGGNHGEVANPAPGLIQLSLNDHRHLLFLLRSDDELTVDCVGEPFPNETHLESRALTGASLISRLTRIIAAASTTAAPVFLADAAAAQCQSPSGGTGDYDSGSSYTAIDGGFVQGQEGGIAAPTTSASGLGTGVTINGLDLGFQSVSGLQSMGFSPGFISQASPYIGKVGSPAISAYNKTTPSALNAAFSPYIQDIYDLAYPAYFSAAAGSFNALSSTKANGITFSSLPMQWQTVWASMYFQSSPAKVQTSNKFMQTKYASQMVQGQLSSAYLNLKSFGGPSVPQNQRAKMNASYLSNTGCTN